MADLERRVSRLETRTEAVTEAIRRLAHGLEKSPLAEPGENAVGEAARRAYDLLLVTDPQRAAGQREARRT